MRKWIIGLATLLVAGCASVGSMYGDFSRPYKASVQMVIGDSRPYCSGTIVKDTPSTFYVLTAGHCRASDPTLFSIKTDECGLYKVSAGVYNNIGTDVGVVAIDKGEKRCKLTSASLARNLSVGEPVMGISYPGMLTKTISFGYVAALEQFVNNTRFNVFEISGGPGSSGSGIFNTKGEIVGVLTGPATGGFGHIRGSTIEDIQAVWP